MSKTLQLRARSDLSMRKGKLAAQIGHASCAQLLNSMEDRGDHRYLSPDRSKDFDAFLENPLLEFGFVEGEQGIEDALFDKTNASRIVDRGLTEFGGVHTLTCAAEGLFPLEPKRFVPTAVNPIFARQWLIFSKEQPLRKDDAAVMGALGCLAQLRGMMVADEDGGLALSLENPALKAWLTDGFGKIGMGIKTNEALDSLEQELGRTTVKTHKVQLFGNSMLVVGPAFGEDVAEIMGRESTLYTSGILSLL